MWTETSQNPKLRPNTNAWLLNLLMHSADELVNWMRPWNKIMHGLRNFSLLTYFLNKVTKQSCNNPSLNTQSCNKGLLVVRDFCFWAVLAAGPMQKKKGLGRLWATFEGGFFIFSGAKNYFKIFFLPPKTWKNHPKKLLIIGPDPFFSVLARLPKRPKNRNPVPPKVP